MWRARAELNCLAPAQEAGALSPELRARWKVNPSVPLVQAGQSERSSARLSVTAWSVPKARPAESTAAGLFSFRAGFRRWPGDRRLRAARIADPCPGPTTPATAARRRALSLARATR